MINLSYQPFKCEYSEPFDRVFTQKGIEQDQTAYEGTALKFSGIIKDELVTKTHFTYVEKSKIRQITVEGSLYLHDCLDEIDTISATQDIIIYKCAKVNHIFTKGNLFLIDEPENFPKCQYDEINVNGKFDYILLVEKLPPPKLMTLENCSTRSVMLNKDCTKVEVKGDCSQVAKIMFQGDSTDERQVVVKKGAIFTGEIVGGQVIFEDFN